MTSRLTTAELTYYANAPATLYPEIAANLNWLAPCVKALPAGIKTVSEDVITKFEAPASSALLGTFKDVAVLKTAKTANVIRRRYRFLIPEAEMEAARRLGLPLPTNDITTALRQIANCELHQVLENNHTWEAVAGSGMRTGGTNVDGTAAPYNAAIWDAATKPLVHAKAAYGELHDAGFEPPYVWILSSNLMPYIRDLNDAANPSSEMKLASDLFGFTTIAEASIGTSTEAGALYGFDPASSDDGVWIACKVHPDNFVYYKRWPTPQVVMDPVMDTDLLAYKGYVTQDSAFVIKQATSIQYNQDVDATT